MSGAARSGRVCVTGRANTGKSTLINALLGQPLLTVTHRPQTTRQVLPTRLRLDRDQLVLVDTPGLHRHKRHENRLMNRAALAEAEGADIVLAVFDRTIWRRDDEYLLKHCGEQSAVCIAAINKMDLIRDKARVLPRIAQLHDSGAFAHVVPLSAASGENMPELLQLLLNFLPSSPNVEEDDTEEDSAEVDDAAVAELTDEYLIGEAVREQLLLRYRREVPHDARVELEQLRRKPDRIAAEVSLLVKRDGQRRILLGRDGRRLQALCRAAEKACSRRLGTRVRLELDVRLARR